MYIVPGCAFTLHCGLHPRVCTHSRDIIAGVSQPEASLESDRTHRSPVPSMDSGRVHKVLWSLDWERLALMRLTASTPHILIQ